MTLWAIRHKETGLFYNGGDKFVETPVNKLYRKEGHAKAAMTILLNSENSYNRYQRRGKPESWEYRNNLEVVQIKAEVVENAELV